MANERYVLLGVATPRARWFREVGQWAQSAAIPAEFVRCVSIAEMRARLASGRPFSAVLVDGQLGGIDRDLVATASGHGCPVIVVDDRGPEPYRDLAPSAVLSPPFTRDALLDTLAANAKMVGGAVVRTTTGPSQDVPAKRGEVVAVLGPGGTGASTAAIALAEGLAGGGHAVDGPVLLADLCRSADQAMLHDSRVVVPGVQELVEAHRTGTVPTGLVRDQTFEVAGRGYRLLLGLRRSRHFVTVRPRAFDAALDSLRRTFAVTVCDVDPDLEGEAETGSLDVEERHLMTRATVARSSVIYVVGAPGLKGVFSTVRLVGELLGFGAPAERIVPVVSRGPRNPRQRAEFSSSFRQLLGANVGEGPAKVMVNPVHLLERRVDEALRDGVGMPKPLPSTLAGAYHAVLERVGPLTDVDAGPSRITPGSLPASAAREATHRD
ncbi:MAG: hypothetical protein WEB03_01195 [Nitriliruptor sp.]|uniref:hypothetical protein n=1 Tax=Nitriliruptor sp. TaxID=2448056 RepID=UPI0034A07D16